MLYPQQIDHDLATLSGFYGNKEEYDAAKLKMPKVPLTIAILMEKQLKTYWPALKDDGWRQVGWYVGCHEPFQTGYTVHLLCKEQDVPATMGPLHNPYYRFDQKYGLPLSCSCRCFSKRPKLLPSFDKHAAIGLYRQERKPKTVKEVNNWHWFANTPLYSYWFWGLLPEETDRNKFEKGNRRPVFS